MAGPIPSLPEPKTAIDPHARFRAALAAFLPSGFAVVDGDHFKDLPALFRRERLFARSLFLDKANPAARARRP